MSKGNFSAVWVLHRQGMEGRGRREAVVQPRQAVRKTHKLIHKRFKSISKLRWRKFLYQ